MADETVSAQHSVTCLRLMQAVRRVSRGMRRWQDGAAPVTAPLSPRHSAALAFLKAMNLLESELQTQGAQP
jgi:hypothetical protein